MTQQAWHRQHSTSSGTQQGLACREEYLPWAMRAASSMLAIWRSLAASWLRCRCSCCCWLRSTSSWRRARADRPPWASPCSTLLCMAASWASSSALHTSRGQGNTVDQVRSRALQMISYCLSNRFSMLHNLRPYICAAPASPCTAAAVRLTQSTKLGQGFIQIQGFQPYSSSQGKHNGLSRVQGLSQNYRPYRLWTP